MLFNYDSNLKVPVLEPNKKLAFYSAKKMLPEYVFDTSQLENNPLTFPEVQTLMDGITIGGHKVSDMQQVLNIKDSWYMLLEVISRGEYCVSKEMFHAINNLIARGESLEWGKFRTGSVGISGTEKYKSPKWQELDLIFDSELPIILGSLHPVEQAIRLFLWAAYNQFYWDGNKRTARLMASGILINAGYGVFNIRAKDILEFNTLMVDFYETAQANKIVNFLVKKCIRSYE